MRSFPICRRAITVVLCVPIFHFYPEARLTSYSQVPNPYLVPPHYHPVESALAEACAAADQNNVPSFKAHRATVLEYLEPQYQRIMAASTALTTLIKYQKTQCGLLDPTSSCFVHHCDRLELERDDFSELTMLLETYSTALSTRDVPYRIQIIVRKNQVSENLRDIQLTDMLLMQLSRLLARTQTSPWEATAGGDWVSCFQRIVGELDREMLAMRAARKALFEDDGALSVPCSRGVVGIDPEPWRCDEKVLTLSYPRSLLVP